MDRIRLTKRMASKARRADSAEPETAIDLGKNRTYHKIDEYHTFKPSLNHWEPDMRHEWKDNPRTETGHGIPKMAKVYMAAKKATKLAMMLLGDNATEASIENQARAFMRMGDKALTASIERWAECKGDKCEEACKFSDEDGEKKEEACKFSAEDDEKKEEAPVEEAPKAEAPAEDAAPVEDGAKEDVPAEPAEGEGDVTVDDELIPTDIDFDEPEDSNPESDEDLEACFAADDGEEAAPATETGSVVAKKAGIRHLAGQPTLTRVASAKNADELTGLWDKWDNTDIR